MKISEEEAEGRGEDGIGERGGEGECQRDNVCHIVSSAFFFKKKAKEENSGGRMGLQLCLSNGLLK